MKGVSPAPAIPEQVLPTFEPSGLSMGGELPMPSEVGAIRPPTPIAPGARPVRATTQVRLAGEAAQRAADFEKAMAEKVAQEQQAPAHPDKPLTANQLKIIQDSLRNEILSGQIGRERPGVISGSGLELWADKVIGETASTKAAFSGLPFDGKLMAAGVVKAAALLERGIIDVAQWTAAMVKEFGESIRPFLNDIRSQAEQLRLSTQKGGEKDAIQQKAEGAVRDVQQPEVAPEGAGQVPAREGSAQAAEARVAPTTVSEVGKPQAGERLVELVKEDGTTEIVSFGDKYFDWGSAGRFPMVGRWKNGGWSHTSVTPKQSIREIGETKPVAPPDAVNELAPAVRIGGRVISDPNKGHIQMALEIGGPDALADVSNPANQGFLYKGEFLSREAAASLIGEKNPLTSERLRELRSPAKEPTPQVESVTALDPKTGSPIGSTESLINKLEALKFKPEGGTHELHALRPDILQRVGRQLWNDAIDLAIFTIRSGKSIAEAIDAALAHIRKTRTGIDEAPMRAELQRMLGPETSETPTARPAATPPPVPAAAPVDPITGEPAKLVTEKEAKAMERKVKLPAETDVKKLTEQIDLFNREIGDALESGGQFLPKELRPDVAKGAPAEKGTVTNKAINQYFVNKLSSIRKQMQAARNRIAQQADIESQVYFDTLQKRFETAFRQVQELRRTSHEALYFWNKIRAEYQDIARAAGQMPEMKKQKPIIDQIWKDFRDGQPGQAISHAVDYFRMNLFTASSWTLDFGTNLIASAARIPAWGIMDLGAMATGRAPTKMFSAIRALQNGMRNWNPLGKRYRLPDKIESELGTTAGGEFGGRGREVFVDFSEILRNHPEMADKLRHIDKLIGAPVRMKRAVDGFFGRFGAAAELYNRAYIEGKSRGLRGDELKTFVEEFVQNPSEAAISRAIKTGQELKFNRDLTRWEEAFSGHILTKLVVEAFPRWTLQFIRWGGEMIGADPVFFKDLVTGKATPEQAVNYLTKAATGWGGIYAFNQLAYDNIDPNTMEYVKEDGNRVRLSGRTPAPELFFICAVLRGDSQNAKAALQHLSLPGAKLLSGDAGVLGPLFDTIKRSIEGRYTAEQTARELTKLVNDAIPGKSVLGLIRSIYDPTIREGVGAPIPGVAEFLPQPVDPTTGEPRAPKTRIPGTSIELPTVGGTPFPGAERVLNNVESALLNHGLGNVRPRRTSIIDLPAEDVPKQFRREYEQMAGRNVKELIGEEIKSPEFWKEDFDIRREILSQLLAEARSMAREDLADKYGTSGEPVKSVPLNVQRLPKRLRPQPASDKQQ